MTLVSRVEPRFGGNDDVTGAELVQGSGLQGTSLIKVPLVVPAAVKVLFASRDVDTCPVDERGVKGQTQLRSPVVSRARRSCGKVTVDDLLTPPSGLAPCPDPERASVPLARRSHTVTFAISDLRLGQQVALWSVPSVSPLTVRS